MKTRFIQYGLIAMITAVFILVLYATFYFKSSLFFLVGSIFCILLNEAKKTILNDMKQDEKNKHFIKSIKK